VAAHYNFILGDKRVELRGIPFGNILSASGVQGFFGEGYWFHPYLKPFGLDFENFTFVAKTTTLEARSGNLPLRDDFTPRELMPKCIHVKPLRGVALNALGLSGPGASVLLQTGRWQARRKPFFISFMSVDKTAQGRIDELKGFVELFGRYLPQFRTHVGLQINYSCPNVGLHPSGLVNEVEEGLSIASRLGIPLMPKFNVMLPSGIAKKIGDHPACDALCISNTIPYGQLLSTSEWEKLFGPASPLKQYGGGGLSGRPLLPLLIKWLTQIRDIGFTKPINAGGGILSLDDARHVLDTGANSIFLGSIAFLRPWRVRKIGRVIGRFHEKATGRQA
jgi:dihydroorotate dehydrogenase